jgi:hypothetical protein
LLFSSTTNAQQKNLSLSIGVGTNNGEVGYNEFLLLSPLYMTSRPNISIQHQFKTRSLKTFDIGLTYNNYSALDEYSSKSYFVQRNWSLNGNSFIFNCLYLTPTPIPWFKIGIGAGWVQNFYKLNDVTYSTNSPIIQLGGQILFGKLKFNDEISLRYVYTLNLRDNFDGITSGVVKDNHNSLQLNYTIPYRFIKSKWRNMGQPTNRQNKNECPSF